MWASSTDRKRAKNILISNSAQSSVQIVLDIFSADFPMPKKRALRPDEALKPRGRPGIIPPLGVDFETAIKGLLGTPPPPDEKLKPKARKRKASKR